MDIIERALIRMADDAGAVARASHLSALHGLTATPPVGGKDNATRLVESVARTIASFEVLSERGILPDLEDFDELVDKMKEQYLNGTIGKMLPDRTLSGRAKR